MNFTNRKQALGRKLLVALGIAMIAACSKTPPPAPPPPPPPPPPPVAEVIPYRPIPPLGAPYVMPIPAALPDGSHVTINSNLDPHETVWHFRSGWNVAALNCTDPQYQPIVDAYGAFLKKYDSRLDQANAAIDTAYRREHGTRNAGIKAREEFMTSVYNYFALPAVRGTFCNEALVIANESLANPPTDSTAFATQSLMRYEAVFDAFFREYEKYRADSAAWDARYGAQYGASQPGYVAVHGTQVAALAPGLGDGSNASVVGSVVDPATGASIPIIEATGDALATPVIQPVPSSGK